MRTLALILFLGGCCPPGTPPGVCNPSEDKPSTTTCPVGLVITEVMADAPGTGSEFPEWIELVNTGEADASLAGLQVERVSGTSADTILADGVVAPGDHVVLAAADAVTYDFEVDVVYDGLNLVGEAADLYLRCDGTELDHVSYAETDEGTAWQLDPEAEDSVSNDDADRWCAATTALGDGFGTPGEPNVSCPEPVVCPEGADVAITEVLPDSAADDEGWEFVEVVNLGVEAVPVSCIELLEGETVRGLEDCTGSVQPGELLLLARDPASFPDVPLVCGVGISLNNSGEASLGLSVSDAAGAWTSVFEMACTPPECPFDSGVSAQVDPGAYGSADMADWCASTSMNGSDLATPGTANEACGEEDTGSPDTGPDATPCAEAELLLTEVMPNPSQVTDDHGEYVEVYNAGDTTVDLDGLEEPCSISDTTLLAPGSWLVLVKDDVTKTNGGIEGGVSCGSFASIVNTGGTVELACDTTLDSYTYGAATEGVAIQRGWDGTTHTDTWCDATLEYGLGDLGSPGDANQGCE